MLCMVIKQDKLVHTFPSTYYILKTAQLSELINQAHKNNSKQGIKTQSIQIARWLGKAPSKPVYYRLIMLS